MRRSAAATLNQNHYFILGFLLGLLLSFYIPESTWIQDECSNKKLYDNRFNSNSNNNNHNNNNNNLNDDDDKFNEDFEPHINLINKPLAAKKPVKNVIRPRYYSSELGIREKLFIGVMTSQDNINTLATAINRTTAHLINKIKFFINADNVKTNFKLKNIVGFTDTRENLRPFHILKYIADNYLDDYDYFFITPDTTYVDAKQLMKLLYHISITFDIYMGYKIENNSDNLQHIYRDIMNSDSSYSNYCDLNTGIMLSSSVIKKMRANLDWCVRNSVTNFHSLNIGRCVKYSTRITACQDSFQGIKIKSFQLDNNKLYKDLKFLQNDENFQNASIIYPVTNVDDFYILHAYFSRLNLDKLKKQSYKLEAKAYNIGNGTISNEILEIQWPLGVPQSSIPDTRHDILTWNLLNRTHSFMPNHEHNVEQLNRIDTDDLNRILNITLSYAKRKYATNKDLKYENIHTIYRRFDPVRGMDYQIHLNFRNQRTRETKSFYVVKPLGRVEIVPSPYVTESTRITILLPTFEHQTSSVIDFIKQYEKICMKNQDNTFLLMIFLYRFDSQNKGESDPFRNIKTLALELSTKYKTDGSRIAWVSIRLPTEFSQLPKSDEIMLNSLYGRNEILSIAVTDLALPKIGLDSLVMLGSNSMTFRTDFLNRIRMNTIPGFQIFAPIGFMQYPCNFVNFCKECDSCDVSQSTGYFDKWNYDVVSFYSRDYVEARKKLDEHVPIIHNDNDISALLNSSDKSINSLVDIFVASKSPIHILRGIEPNLRFGNQIKNYISTNRYNIPKCSTYTTNMNVSEMNEMISLPKQGTEEINSNNIPIMKNDNYNLDNKCIHIAARKQIGDAIIKYEEQNFAINNKKKFIQLL